VWYSANRTTAEILIFLQENLFSKKDSSRPPEPRRRICPKCAQSRRSFRSFRKGCRDNIVHPSRSAHITCQVAGPVWLLVCCPINKWCYQKCFYWPHSVIPACPESFRASRKDSRRASLAGMTRPLCAYITPVILRTLHWPDRTLSLGMHRRVDFQICEN